MVLVCRTGRYFLCIHLSATKNRLRPPNHHMEFSVTKIWWMVSFSNKNPQSAAFGPISHHLQGKWSYHYSERWKTVNILDLQCILRRVCHRTTFQALEEKLIPVTIFWIFSSFFSMLDLTAQILSCWSLISCSSSASSTLRGSTAWSVALQHIKQNTHIQNHRRDE